MFVVEALKQYEIQMYTSCKWGGEGTNNHWSEMMLIHLRKGLTLVAKRMFLCFRHSSRTCGKSKQKNTEFRNLISITGGSVVSHSAFDSHWRQYQLPCWILKSFVFCFHFYAKWIYIVGKLFFSYIAQISGKYENDVAFYW